MFWFGYVLPDLKTVRNLLQDLKKGGVIDMIEREI